MIEFKHALRDLINVYSKENDSNTGDMILAYYLVDCLEAFNNATKQRDKMMTGTP